MRIYFAGVIFLLVAAVATSLLSVASISQRDLSNRTASYQADTLAK
jgi:hypothetical protein